MRITATIALCFLGFSSLAQTSTQVRILDTMADLVARKPVSGETVQVRNRSSSILWSSPRTFTAYSTSTITNAHDGTHYVTNGVSGSIYASADRLSSDQKAEWFGVVGDNSTDISDEMQAAFNYSGYATNTSYQVFTSELRGTRVLLPSGLMVVSKPIRLYPGTSVKGAGRDLSKIVNTGTTNDVFVADTDLAGAMTPWALEDFTIYQKSGITHTAGRAIWIKTPTGDGPLLGAVQLQISRVATAKTWKGIEVNNAYATRISDCQFAYHGDAGLTTGWLTTSTTIQNCYATYNDGDGYSLEGQYISAINTASDGNGGWGYRLGYNGSESGAFTGISIGAEQNAAGGIIVSNWLSTVLVSPLVVSRTNDGPAFLYDSGRYHRLVNPLAFIESNGANTNPVIAMRSVSTGQFPYDVALEGAPLTVIGGWSALTDRPLALRWTGAANLKWGQSENTMRIGPGTTVSDQDAVQLHINATHPKGGGGVAYAQHIQTRYSTNYVGAYGMVLEPVIDAGANTITSQIDALMGGPTLTSGTVNNSVRLFLRDTSAGSTLNAGLVLGSFSGATGNWGIYSTTDRESYIGGVLSLNNLRIGRTGDPTLTNDYHFAVTAPMRGATNFQSYSVHLKPTIDRANSVAAGLYTEPQVAAPGLTVTNVFDALMAGPTVSTGAVSRAYRLALRESTVAANQNGALLIGNSVPWDGANWSIVNASANEMGLAPPIRWLSPAGPLDWAGSGSPESAVTAPPGSLWRRTDSGGLWVKSSGTGNTGWTLLGSGGGGGGATNGTIVEVNNGGGLSDVDLTTSARISFAEAGGVVTADIVSDSITTNQTSVAFETFFRDRANHTGTQAWSTLTSTPTTLSGYGITDAQPLDADLTRIATVTWASGDIAYHDGTGLTNLATTAAGRTLLTAPDAAAQRTALAVTNYQGGVGVQITGTNFSHNIEAGANVTLSTNSGALVIAGPTAGTKTIKSFLATEGEPPASNYATMSTRNSIGVMLFDHTTTESLLFRWIVPEGYTNTVVNVILKWTTSATSGDGRWGAENAGLTGDIDSITYGTAVEATTTTSATSGTKMTTTLSSVSLNGAVAGDEVWSKVYRDAADAADTINSNDLELHAVEVRAP